MKNETIHGICPVECMMLSDAEERFCLKEKKPRIELGAKFLSEEELMSVLPKNHGVVAYKCCGKIIVWSQKALNLNSYLECQIFHNNKIGAHVYHGAKMVAYIN